MIVQGCYDSWKRDTDRVPVIVDSPSIIEGAEVIETLCPVSKLTGHRCNPLSLLKTVTDSNARLLDNILQVLPEVKQMDVPDDVKIDMLVPAEFGSLAERDAQISRLADIADVLFDKSSVGSADASKIEFNPQDASVEVSSE